MPNRSLLKNKLTDNQIFWGTLILSLISVYALPNAVSNVIFFVFLAIFFRSKKDYLWFALVFVWSDAPGGFFPFAEINYGLPIITSPVYLTYLEIFIYIALIKAVLTNRKNNFIYKKPLMLLGFYMILLFIVSYTIGMSGTTFFKSIKWMLPWTLIYTIPRLMKNIEQWDGFFSLIFPIVFISLIFQVIHFTIGYPVAQIFGRNFETASGQIGIDTRVISSFDRTYGIFRSISSVFITFLSFLASMYYLVSKRNIFSEKYLNLILLGSYLNIALSGTRGWIIALTLGLFLFGMFLNKKFFLQLRFFSFFILIFLVTLFVPQLQTQIDAVLLRTNTISFLVKGDVTANNSLARLDTYTPAVMSKFSDNPISGMGFSDKYWDSQNIHVGLPNLLMQVGIIGAILVIIFWWTLLYYPIKINGKLNRTNPYKNSLPVLSIAFFMLLIIHSTSGQQFGYLIGFYGSSFMQLIFYSFSDVLLKTALKNERRSSLPL